MPEPEQPVEVRQSPPSAGGLLRSPDFLKLWGGQTVSSLGSYITLYGLPMLAVITLKASPAQMGILQAAGSAPALLLSLLAGVWVDRLRRRPVMIAADLGRGLILATIPLAAVLGRLSIGQIYAVIALAGMLSLFFNSAYRAYLPSLVAQQSIQAGNSRLAMSESLAEMVGPGIAGLLVQTIGAPLAILFDALSYGVSVISLGLIRKPEARPVATGERQPAVQEAREGLKTISRQPLLRALAGQTAVSSFFGSFIGVLYTLYAIRLLHLSPAGIGLTVGVGGVSSLVGSFLAGRVTRRFGLGRSLVGLFFIGILFTLLIPLAASLPTLGLGLLLLAQSSDLFGMIYQINVLSLRQSITPPRLQGRVNASFDLLTAGASPLGALAGGFLAGTIGMQTTLFLAAGGLALSGLFLVFSPLQGLINWPSAALPD
jgi:predicted MFS family arabinose efflux permease